LLNKAQYEKRILNEIRSMPEEALPGVFRILALLREEFTVRPENSEHSEDGSISHKNTRKLLASSQRNWSGTSSRTGRIEYERLFLRHILAHKAVCMNCL
jgi:hypothetical protein